MPEVRGEKAFEGLPVPVNDRVDGVRGPGSDLRCILHLAEGRHDGATTGMTEDHDEPRSASLCGEFDAPVCDIPATRMTKRSPNPYRR
jgi:hypothetical protein